MEKTKYAILCSAICVAIILSMPFMALVIWLAGDAVVRGLTVLSFCFSFSGALVTFDDEHLIKREKEKSLELMRTFKILAFPLFITPLVTNFWLAHQPNYMHYFFVAFYLMLVIVFYLTLVSYAIGLEEEIDCLKCADKIKTALEQNQDRANRLIFSQYTDDEKAYVEKLQLESLHPLCRKEFLLSFDYCCWLAKRYDYKYQLWFNNNF